MDWMIHDNALHLLQPLMPATELNYFFNNHNTFEIGAGELMPDAVQTIDFQDYGVEANDIADHPYAGAALYDLEDWRFSPFNTARQTCILSANGRGGGASGWPYCD